MIESEILDILEGIHREIGKTEKMLEELLKLAERIGGTAYENTAIFLTRYITAIESCLRLGGRL
jgi:hypothetical protein